MTLQELQDRKIELDKIVSQLNSQLLVMHGQKSEVEYLIQLELNKAVEEAELANTEEQIVE